MVSMLKPLHRIYPELLHITIKAETRIFYYLMMCQKTVGWVANSVDHNQTLHSVVFNLGLYCLLRPVCLNTLNNYGIKYTKLL